MPRMNLTDQEAEIILKKREAERFFKAGYACAIENVLHICQDVYDDPARQDTWHTYEAAILSVKEQS